MPLYVGKSINLRERVASHFSSDYRSANDLRLSSEVVRIEFEETAGELGALLREYFGSDGIPVVRNIPFGHHGDNLLMPIGAPVRLSTADNSFTITAPAVERR